MWLELAVVGALLGVLPSADGKAFRIIAGRRASTLEFPYQAELQRRGRHWCGGSIIHRRFILTASHCVKEMEGGDRLPKGLLSVRVGNDVVGSGGEVYEVSEIITHEEFSMSASMDEFDIALLRLSEPLKLSERVGVVRLASEEPSPGERGWVSGYGRQEMMRRGLGAKRHLMAVELPVVGLEECRKMLPGVADDMICAGHKKGNRDACTGDSGGPYVVGEEQVGVVAWGLGCGREGVPGVYTNVAMYKGWVEEKMRRYREEDEE